MKRINPNFFIKATLAILILLAGALFFFKTQTQPVASLEQPQKSLTVAHPNDDFNSNLHAPVQEPKELNSQAKLNMAAKNKRAPNALLKPNTNELAQQPLVMDQRWKIWKSVKSVNDQTNGTENEVIGTINHFKIIKSNDEDESSLAQFNKEAPIVVYDERLKKAGLITGMLKIETSDRIQLEKDLLNENAHIFDSFENIQTYFISGNQQIFNLELLYNKLKSFHYIKTIELEITKTLYEKN